MKKRMALLGERCVTSKEKNEEKNGSFEGALRDIQKTAPRETNI